MRSEEKRAIKGSALSPREIEILSGVAHGLELKEIAVKLGISSHTARTHAQSAYAKLGVRSAAHAVYTFMRQPLLPVAKERVE